MKRILALILAVLTVLSATGITAFAAKDDAVTTASAENPAEGHKTGDKITFGSYPRTKVTDSTLIRKLDVLYKKWSSYNYCTKAENASDGTLKYSDYMRYCDVVYGDSKYRAVYFTQYRPSTASDASDALRSLQDDNGYDPETVYYFKYEPLEWIVLDAGEGYVVSEDVVDSQAFNNYIVNKSGSYYGDVAGTYYASEWARSSLRSWLNGSFYDSAFSAAEKAVIGTSQLENKSTYSSGAYDSSVTYDKVFIPTYFDVLNTSYGFSSSASSTDALRKAKGTDYAKCQGLYVAKTLFSENSNPLWRLRTSDGSSTVWNVDNYGKVYNFFQTNNTSYGIRPAIKFSPAAIKRTLTFNAVGGSVEETSRSVVMGSAIGTLPVPVLAGFAFEGWFTSSDGGYKVSASTIVNTDMVLYAHWTPAPLEVYFETEPAKRYYNINERFDFSGAVIKVKYGDATVKTLTPEEVTLSGFDSSKKGACDVYISYTDKGITATSAPFRVAIDFQLESLDMTGMPAKTKYIIGESFDGTGIVAVACFSDGTTQDVTNDLEISGFDSSCAGEKVITLKYSYEGKTATAQYNYTVVPILTQIALEQLPDKTQYVKDEEFSSQGMKVVAYFSDGSTVDVTDKVTLEGFDSTVFGEGQVTVSYTFDDVTLTQQFGYTVVKSLTGITVDQLPDKTKYTHGDSFEKDGMVVTAYFDDATTADVTDEVTIDGFDTTAVGTGNVTVSFTLRDVTKTAQFDYSVELTLKDLSITSLPNKTEYVRGESFERDGMVVIATFSDGSQKDVSNNIKTSGFATKTTGEKTMTVRYTYGETTLYADFVITVVTAHGIQGNTLTSFYITKKPQKTIYYMGEEFDPTGLTAIANYSDGTSEEVTANVTFSGFDSAEVGTRKITVSYTYKEETLTAQFSYIIRAYLTDLKIENVPDKTEYVNGESFDPSGMVVIATFSDGSSKDVSNNIKTSGFTTKTTGEKTMTVKYTFGDVTMSDTFTITVVKQHGGDSTKTLTSLYVTKKPQKTIYYMGEEFDSTGMTVMAYYSDGTSEDVTDIVSLGGFDSAEVGTRKITVSYTYKEETLTAQFSYIIRAYLTDLKIENVPDKTEYIYGESFDPSGMVVIATFSDGSSKDVSNNIKTSGFTTKTTGEKTMTVKYTYGDVTMSDTFTITVVKQHGGDSTKTLTSLYVTKKPQKTIYYMGDDFDPTGLTAIANYSDGTSEEVTANVTLSGFDSAEVGTRKITVSYTYKEETLTAQFSYIIRAYLTDLRIENVPDKTEYIYGESFDPSGMVVIATFSDGSSKDVSNNIKTSGFTTKTTGEKTMTVKYTYGDVTMSDTFTITVVESHS